MQLPRDDSIVANPRRAACTRAATAALISFLSHLHLPSLDRGTRLSKSQLSNHVKACIVLISWPGLMSIMSRERDYGECRSPRPMQRKHACTPVTPVRSGGGIGADDRLPTTRQSLRGTRWQCVGARAIETKRALIISALAAKIRGRLSKNNRRGIDSKITGCKSPCWEGVTQFGAFFFSSLVDKKA